MVDFETKMQRFNARLDLLLARYDAMGTKRAEQQESVFVKYARAKELQAQASRGRGGLSFSASTDAEAESPFVRYARRKAAMAG